MRQPIHNDLTAMARAVHSAGTSSEKILLAREIMAKADQADQFRAEKKRPHPTLGDGSIEVVALAMNPVCEPRLTDPDFLESLICCLTVLREHALGGPVEVVAYDIARLRHSAEAA